MRKVTVTVLLLCGLLIVAAGPLLFLNDENEQKLTGQNRQVEHAVMDQVLADDLSMTTSLFVAKLNRQLDRWSEQDFDDPTAHKKFTEELNEHPHFHAFAVVNDNKKIVTSEGEITAEEVKKLVHTHDGVMYSDPYTENGKQYFLVSKKKENDTKESVVGKIDLSFVKRFVNNTAAVADANGNFFISGEDPEVDWESADEAIKSQPSQLVPELGWQVVVRSEEPTDEGKHYHEHEAVVIFINEEKGKAWINEHPTIEMVKNGGPYIVIRDETRTTPQLITMLESEENIESAEPNYVLTKQVPDRNKMNRSDKATESVTIPNDEFFQPYQWNLSQIETERGWDISSGREEVIIAIIDSGVDPDHEDLSAKMTEGFNAFDQSNNHMDEHGHGTHVAGIAAALTNNITGIAGVSWHNQIMPIKVLDENAEGSAFEIANGIRWATDHGAKVINMSLGDAHYSRVIHDAIRYAYNKDVVLIAASGNDNVEQPMYPAGLKEVLAVSAVDYHRNKAVFSNYGNYIDVAAPGEHIPSTFPENHYVYMSGTSMAAPHVAGLAGLIRSIRPDLRNTEVVEIIKKTAVDLGQEGYDKYYGYGEISVSNALDYLNDLP
ncbi:S8 family peptidase [Anaerobacillus sp. MEB173]|uniref:S8 family peptidase n=1 Tax=Anaerobacillus sp. MEB173 TaxID=3383345 RepID=UPI003F926B79